jgi:hypothetical protein
MITSPQQIFDNFIQKIDSFVKQNVNSPTLALIMAEALMVKVKELFDEKGYSEEQTLLFIKHALQELDEEKPTIH